ncbi:MAG TPA: hypothetical protein VIV60_07650 [Polyangiaceae bacterium]
MTSRLKYIGAVSCTLDNLDVRLLEGDRRIFDFEFGLIRSAGVPALVLVVPTGAAAV